VSVPESCISAIEARIKVKLGAIVPAVPVKFKEVLRYDQGEVLPIVCVARGKIENSTAIDFNNNYSLDFTVDIAVVTASNADRGDVDMREAIRDAVRNALMIVKLNEVPENWKFDLGDGDPLINGFFPKNLDIGSFTCKLKCAISQS